MFKTRSLDDNIPFVEAVHIGGSQRPTAIVLRSSFTTGDDGAALGIASAWHNKYNKVDSCHYVVDEANVFRCVQDKVVARPYGSETHNNAIHINVCYEPVEGITYPVLQRAANLTAFLSRLYKINIRILNKDEEHRWMKHKWRSRGGIILKTAGRFPIDKLLDAIELESKLLNGG